MIINGSFGYDWKDRGHVWGECMSHPDIDLMYVYIPKNASSWTKPNLKDYGWQFYNYHTDMLDKHALVALRDPVDRWVSGIAEYFALYHQDFELLNVETIKLIFDRITFDDHTDKQVNFLTHLNTDECTFIYCDDNYSKNFSGFISKYYGTNKYAKYEWQHVSDESPIRKKFKSIISYWLTMPNYLDRIKHHFKDDYKLINSVNFYIDKQFTS